MTYREALKYLDSFVNFERSGEYNYKASLKLERMKRLVGDFDRIWPMNDPPDYEPKPEDAIGPRARAMGRARIRTPSTASRNAPCPCGSGRKYKHCCMT